MSDTIDTAPPPAATVPMRPGRFLRLRREAAGFTLEEVARMLAPAPHSQKRVEAEITLLEQDDPSVQGRGLAEDLRDIFDFDLEVYEALVIHAADPDSETPLPQICRLCACSFHDPCIGADHQPCAWAAPDLCTHCVPAAALGAAVMQANGTARPAAGPVTIGVELASGPDMTGGGDEA